MTADFYAPRILVMISGQKVESRSLKMMEKCGLPVFYHFHGQGTASHDLVSLLGLAGREKSVLVSVVPRGVGERILHCIRDAQWLGTHDTGIAFTVPMQAASKHIMKYVTETFVNASEEEEPFHMESAQFSLISVICNRGYSEDVMQAAKSAGARGGTVLNSRCITDGDAAFSSLGFAVQEEKETLLIVVESKKRKEVMSAISSSCGMTSKAQGLVLSMPVEDVVGMPTEIE